MNEKVDAPEDPAASSAVDECNDETNGGKNHAVGENPPSADDAASSSSHNAEKITMTPMSTSFGLVRVALTLAFGAAIGALAMSRLLDSEYRSIASEMAASHRRSLSRAHDNSAKCRLDATVGSVDAKFVAMEEALATAEVSCRIRADELLSESTRKELEFRRSAESLLRETNDAYAAANALAADATAKIRTIEFEWTERYDSARVEADERYRNATVMTEHWRNMVRTSGELSISRQAKHELIAEELAALRLESDETKAEFDKTKADLDEALADLIRRDVERADCDKYHRELSQCEKNVRQCPPAREFNELRMEHRRCAAALTRWESDADELQKQLTDKRDELSVAREVRIEQAGELKQCYDSLSEEEPECPLSLSAAEQKIEQLREATPAAMLHLLQRLEEAEVEEDAANERLEEVSERLERAEASYEAASAFEVDLTSWRNWAEELESRIQSQSEKEVSRRFGEGPHRVEMVFEFPSDNDADNTGSRRESIILEMAPLNVMPHAVHAFLDLVDRNVYVGCTFIVARGHVLVAGPMDIRNPENTVRLEQSMEREGLVGHGAMAFMEYDERFPHVKYTLGFNASGGRIFYANIMDNSVLHGPKEEDDLYDVSSRADPCFAKVVRGTDVIDEIVRSPVANDDMFANPPRIMETHLLF